MGTQSAAMPFHLVGGFAHSPVPATGPKRTLSCAHRRLAPCPRVVPVSRMIWFSSACIERSDQPMRAVFFLLRAANAAPPRCLTNETLSELLATARPIHRDHSTEAEHHSNFGFDVGEKFCDPRRSVSLPIDQGSVARYKISQNPNSRPHQRNNLGD